MRFVDNDCSHVDRWYVDAAECAEGRDRDAPVLFPVLDPGSAVGAMESHDTVEAGVASGFVFPVGQHTRRAYHQEVFVALGL